MTTRWEVENQAIEIGKKQHLEKIADEMATVADNLDRICELLSTMVLQTERNAIDMEKAQDERRRARAAMDGTGR